MQFPESWLREFCNPPLNTPQLAELLTMSGMEVEELRPVAPPFSGVVVAQILSAEPHPQAERLRVCQVDAGTRVGRTANDLQRAVHRVGPGIHRAHAQAVGLGVRLGAQDLGHDDAGKRRRHRAQVFDLHARHREQVGQLLGAQRWVAELAQPGLGELHVISVFGVFSGAALN